MLGNRKVHTENWKEKTVVLVFDVKKSFFNHQSLKIFTIYVFYMYVGEDYLLNLVILKTLYNLTKRPLSYSLEQQAMVNKRMK